MVGRMLRLLEKQKQLFFEATKVAKIDIMSVKNVDILVGEN
jgi:hypothetical protein